MLRRRATRGKRHSPPSVPCPERACIPRHAPCVRERLMSMARGLGCGPSSPMGRDLMNKDVLQGKWREMKGKVKEQWGNLTDDDLDKIDGKSDQIVGLLQQRYGYAREKAEEEYRRFSEHWSEQHPAHRR